MNAAPSSTELKRGLRNRHIQLIALGGAIGTGLFLGVAQTIKLAGPAVLLGYALAGVIAFFIMRQLGELVVEEPVAGSFSHFANRYWGPFAGFASGWNYWVLYVLVSMAELTAVGIYVQYWFPGVPTWASALVCFVLINGINLLHVKLFGELEFWFSIVKVLAIVCMIGFGLYLLGTDQAGPQAGVSNLWALGGFFPHGIGGLAIPKATNQVIYRILIFYVGALAVLLSLFPWSKVQEGGSPFVMIFQALDSQIVATVLNVVVLTAALSVYNSCVYCNSRMLLGLAQQGHAPAVLGRVNQRGIPLYALGVSAVATGSCVLLNYLMPGQAFGLLMALVVAAAVINWTMISVTHLKFRHAMSRQGRTARYPSWAHPWSNYLCLAFMAGILLVMWLTPEMRLSVLLLPVWMVCLWVGYAFKQRAGRVQADATATVSAPDALQA
jgi:aromatic amino acid transport protein AroP